MPPTSPAALRRIGLVALAASGLATLPGPAHAAEPLSIEDAIRGAWSRHPGLRASGAQVEAARADADAARRGFLPTLGLAARGVRTDEPLMAFGLTLDQGLITASDFDPARLNDPEAVSAIGAGVTLSQPIYAGGRISAGRRATAAQASAQAAAHEGRRHELALGVVEAYFGAHAAEEGLRHAQDLLAQASETERFVRARGAQGLALDADVARVTAFRAQAEAELAAARQRVSSARSALALLAGDGAAEASLTTPLEGEVPALPAGDPSSRPSLRAARLQSEAADAAVGVARGSLLPSIGAQASLETLRTTDLDEGTTWYALGVVARWDLSLGDASRLRAARARAAAATDAATWEERQARRDADEARRAVDAADARVRSATEAVAAATSAHALRRARHEQGLLPLTDVLDAETALAGARALLTQGRFEARTARARLALALGLPIEGTNP